MSILFFMTAATALEAAKEGAHKAREILHHKRFKHQQRSRRKQRAKRKFI